QPRTRDAPVGRRRFPPGSGGLAVSSAAVLRRLTLTLFIQTPSPPPPPTGDPPPPFSGGASPPPLHRRLSHLHRQPTSLPGDSSRPEGHRNQAVGDNGPKAFS
ncbi:unnamed protein product, partial [Urochloa humidicola]